MPRKGLALFASLVLCAGACGCPGVTKRLGGASSKRPADMRRQLSRSARNLLKKAYEGIEPRRLRDYHTHIVGLGRGGTGAYANPRMQSWSHPIDRLKFDIYLTASGVEDLTRADELYVARLLDLIRSMGPHGRHHILGFDQHHLDDGTPSPEHSEFYTPNEYVMRLAAEHPAEFLPTISVHPYRPDAVEALERWADKGARFVKWLPNAMGIDPADPRTRPFYKAMAAHGMVLLIHAGEEKAVDAEEAQKLGNPLRLRAALDAGVRVIVAHCASLGQNVDLDDPARPLVDNFDLFLRLMDTPEYRGRLFGEISAMTQTNRLYGPLETILRRQDLHGRLVNGSDYPLPAINVLVRTQDFVSAGWISKEQRRDLNEIYDYNPLLFDFALKRTLRLPSGERLSASIFMANPGLSALARP